MGVGHGLELSSEVRQGRSAIYWSWYASNRRASLMGYRGFQGRQTNSEWRIMLSLPKRKYGMAVGKQRPGRKVHIVRDQIVAKHDRHPEQRMTRWLCGAYTYEAALQWDTDSVCSQCLSVAQHRSIEPMPHERTT